MIELPLIFLGGLLGSAHCVGMCGGFAVMVGGRVNSWRANLARQCVYSAGRIFTYAALGAVVGYAGLRLAQDMPRVVNAQGVLAIIAGMLLIGQGLISAGLLSRAKLSLVVALPTRGLAPAARGTQATAIIPCLTGGMLGSLLRTQGSQAAFLAGMLTGFLPCGLVYGYLVLATSTNNPLAGLITMVAFGLGTVPLMVVTGAGMSLFSPAKREFVLHLAAWCVVATGVIALARGVYALEVVPSMSAASCPFCR
jgi:uncharacterized protein